MNAPLYTTEILRLAASLQPPRDLDRVDGVAEMRSPTCGATVKTAVMLDGEGRLVELSRALSACAFGQASAALVQRGSAGKDSKDVAAALDSLSAWLDGRRDDPGPWPALDLLAPARSKAGRHGAVLLPFRALLQAMSR